MARGSASGTVKSVIVIGTVLAGLAVPAQAQNWLGYGQQFLGQITRQQQADQRRQQMEARRQEQERQAAEARERMPHAVSANYTGELRPMGDPRSLISGKTLYLERPIVASQQLVRMETEEIYFAANGKVYFPSTPTMLWTTNAEGICLSANQQQRCLPAYVDSNRQIFFAAKPNMLSRLARIGNGDSANNVVRYAQYQRQVEANNRATGQMVQGLLEALIGGGGGGSSGSWRDGKSPQQIQQEYQRDNRMSQGAPY